MSEEAGEELTKAREALADGAVLRDHDGSTEAIANRLYYAGYHAAKAVLYARGFEPRTHAGVVAQFGEHVVKEGDAAEDDRRFLARAQTRQEQADYEYEPLRVDVEELFAQTERFVADMEDLI
jgi:uncharacterized protein (UPF0332 family)